MDSNNNIKDCVKTYFAFRFTLALVMTGLGFVTALIFMSYFVIHEMLLEQDYQRKYGGNWKSEFERYHGSLSYAHVQIAICVGSVIAVTLVIIGYYYFTQRSHKRVGHVMHLSETIHK